MVMVWWLCHIQCCIRISSSRVNLVKWGISIAVMPMVVGSTLSLVGSGQCSIVATTNFCYYFWGRYCSWTETNILVKYLNFPLS